MSSEPDPRPAATVMDADEMRRAWTRVAHEVLERNKGVENLAVIGILRKGAPLGPAPQRDHRAHRGNGRPRRRPGHLPVP